MGHKSGDIGGGWFDNLASGLGGGRSRQLETILEGVRLSGAEKFRKP